MHALETWIFFPYPLVCNLGDHMARDEHISRAYELSYVGWLRVLGHKQHVTFLGVFDHFSVFLAAQAFIVDGHGLPA